MGAWGITAFESDAGLDVIDGIRESLPNDGRLTLHMLLEFIKNSQWQEFDDPKLGNSHTSPLAVAELIFKIKDGDYASLDYDDVWAKKYKRFQNLSAFTADKESILWLRDYLTENLAAARNNAAVNNPANPYNGWFHKEDWEGWQTHMESIIKRLEELSELTEEEINLLENEQTQDGSMSMGGMNM